jgi:hypothetical protein
VRGRVVQHDRIHVVPAQGMTEGSDELEATLETELSARVRLPGEEKA